MNKMLKRIMVSLLVVILVCATAIPVFAVGSADDADKDQAVIATAAETESEETAADNSIGAKAIGAAIAVGLAAAAGAIGMGMAVGKATEGISRQPEAEGKIRTTLMLGLVFIETAIIYALIIAILVIFVL